MKGRTTLALALVALAACRSAPAPEARVLQVGDERTPIRSVLLMHRAGEQPHESVTIGFYGTEIGCADIARTREQRAAVTLFARGINPDFSTQRSDALVWSFAPRGGAEKSLMFTASGSKHEVNVTRAGNTANVEVDLDVTDGQRYSLKGSFNAQICY